MLLRLFEQGYLTRPLYDEAKAQDLPTRDLLSFPEEDTDYPYFTSWIKQQVVDQLGGGQEGAQRAFEGGLRVKTTIDSRLQKSADDAIKAWLPNLSGPRASLVAISNKDGMVRAMVGGDNYTTTPFNLATQGQRQPGSAFKPFVLAEALRQNVSPESTWTSAKRTYILKGGERFTVNNYEDAYAGVTTLASATTFSDNSVYAQVAQAGQAAQHRQARAQHGHPDTSLDEPRDVARRPAPGRHAVGHGARLRDVRDRRPAGLRDALPRPERRSVCRCPGPVGIERIDEMRGDKARAVELEDGRKMINRKKTKRVLKPHVASTVSSILQTVVGRGTATRAQIPGVVIAGKTGTTESYGDAWFVGWTKEYTVAVWVGYPDEFKPMETEFQGEPVAGGTYPAGIWKTFMQALLKIHPLPKKDGGDGTGEPTPTPGAAVSPPRRPRRPRPRRRRARVVGPRRRSRSSRRRRSSRPRQEEPPADGAGHA